MRTLRTSGGTPNGVRGPASLLLAFLGIVACQPRAPSTETLALRDGWEFRRADEPPGPGVPRELLDTLSTWLPASVPGTVHTDLLANGLIPDPFWRDTERVLQWIGDEDWIYRTTFQASQDLLEQEVVELVFHGLDTFAEVLLNDRVVLQTDNMFRVWKADVTGGIRPGGNTLQVRFRSPIPPALEARAALPYELPAGNDQGVPPSRVFVRKAAYHYGWDWGPRFVTSGVWRRVELRGWSGGRVKDVHLQTDSILPDAAFLRGVVEVDVSREEAERRAAGGRVQATLTLFSPEGAFEAVSERVTLAEGAQRFTLPIRIRDPRIWWPNGLGEQPLYEVRAALDAGRFTDTATARIGLRTVELVTQPDSVGESFYFRVNGLPVFMKGANVIPLDHFSPRVTEEEYRSLFQDVSAANMNMLRVWGGGIYEEDVFYDLADEYGILLWQDFMFANGMYPGDSLFLATVGEEARDQVRRLRNHPSLALWCGNNEMDEGWKNWGWARAYDTPQDSAAVWNAYEALFHHLLPGVVAQEDPGRRYWPSSPSLGWGRPESLDRGDSHYWGVWHGQEPFRVFAEKLPRFSSEFGFQAFPPMETVEAFTEPEDRNLSDPVLRVHQKHPIGNELITSYMASDYPVPSGFDDFVYVSQLLQARGMRVAFEAHRRARPRTMGTLYWQLNDTWPVVSWSGRDYFGRWKALHFTARETFAPILISTLLRNDTLEVWGVSDLVRPAEGTLFLELLAFDGTSLWQAPVPTRLEPNQSRRLWAGDTQSLVGESDARGLLLVAEYVVDGRQGPHPYNVFYFHPPKDLTLQTPAIHLDVRNDGTGSLLTLTSEVLAKDVYLRLEGATFSDNFFDLLPGRARTVRIEADLTLEEVRAGLRVRTLAEVPREGTPGEKEGNTSGSEPSTPPEPS